MVTEYGKRMIFIEFRLPPPREKRYNSGMKVLTAPYSA